MLVLSRKHSESIMVGDGIEIMVVAVQGDRVRIGISAPRDVAIHRKEIWLQLPHIVAAAAECPSAVPAA